MTCVRALNNMPTITRALISVSDKTGIVDLAQVLHARGVALLSTGGTAATLRQAGLPITEVADHTGFPEMLDGRVKTLHPKIHGGILALRHRPDHQAALQREGITPIDLVVVNLYPFQATIRHAEVTLAEAVEQIDIGGPSLLRAAAKNYPDVVAVCDPADYAAVQAELADGNAVRVATAFRLAQKVFVHTAAYDAAISRYLGRQLELPPYPERLVVAYEKVQSLRYGENPHQQAAWYRVADERPFVSEPLQGKALSYNNLLDADAAIACVREFSTAAVCIVKHTNPCGVGVSTDALVGAFERAQAADPVAAFGGSVGCNRPVDAATATAIVASFFEVVCAPLFTAEAKQIFAAKGNLRLLAYDPAIPVGYRVRSACGGRLVQDADEQREDPATWKVVTKRAPTAEERGALVFAWRVVKHVQSNAIVLTDAERTLGVGAGQMSRVDAVKVAVLKRQGAPTATSLCVAASDAFFPFRDGMDELARAGITAILQPGGSVRDEESIAAANEHGMAMLFTGRRHFRH